MVPRATTLFLCAAWAASFSSFAGEIAGRVVITKPLTKKRIALPSYEQRGVSVSSEPSGSKAVDELRKVVIYLDGDNLGSPKPIKSEIVQRHRNFDPEVVGIPAGSSVTFPNADPVFHNVFSLSKTKSFDLGHYPAGEARTVQFTKPGVVQVYCRLHPNMSAAVLVIPSNYYARPGADGTFRISDVPAGRYRLIAWHKTVGFLTTQVEVVEVGPTEATILLPMTDREASR